MTVRAMGGPDIAQIVAAMLATGADALPITITPTGSPFTYTNSGAYSQRVIVSGGSVLTISVKSGTNGTSYLLGLLGGQVTLAKGDSIVMTYVTAPSITAFNTTTF